MSKKDILASLMVKGGVTRLLDTYWGRSRLTVLAYHRIIESDQPDFDYYQPNVSANPAMFERQMAYVAKHFNVIDLAAFEAFLHEGKPLPPRPLLITFDDGYLDNYANAYPILRKFDLPAVLFLMTSRMDDPCRRPWWDECAYYFHHTIRTQVNLPMVGIYPLEDRNQRKVAREAFMRELKKIPDAQKLPLIGALSVALAVELPTVEPRLFVNWDEVRDMVSNGLACQSHTVTHPILSRVSNEEAYRQVSESREKVRKETNQPATAFAYPNGTPGDYTAASLEALRAAGYKTAFTLESGPMRAEDARKRPLEIARIYLSHRDTMDMFIVKVMGIPALLNGFMD